MKKRKPRTAFNSVMLVDDNEIDNFINERIIAGAHFSKNVLIYSSGKSALEYLINILKTGQQESIIFPEVIFLDINMPMMDGFQFMDEFNKLKNGMKKSPKVVVLTSSMNPIDKQKALHHSIQYFLNKPLSHVALAAILAY